ncbi:MAG TPA: cytochrome c biogenesis protein CcdA [Bacteroidales bacterium]|nr:cytochrome c biogenesis protein CcdA [Bacteroidales bacterium]
MKRTLFIITLLSAFTLYGQIADPVKWTFSHKVINENEVNLVFTANIDNGYHMYGAYFKEGGPIRTGFTFNPSADYQLKGKIVETTKPTIKKDPFFDNMEISIHAKKAVFTQKVRIEKSNTTIKGKLEYMACTDESCLPPVEKEFAFDIKMPEKIASQKVDTIVKPDTLQIIASEKVDSTAINTPLKSAEPLKSESSLWVFFLVALLAGFAGTITPCVFPMIPMTVSYFMQGANNKGVWRGILFGFSIMLVYTLVGVVVSLTSAGADFANQLSTHWLANSIFFLLFIVFALSFLGMFEIVLPSGLVNKADRQADKGGWLGIVFLAVATVLISFSCTGPIVGALLVEAASGIAIKPVLGMFAFGLAFAIPFTFFAIFPSAMKKLPKSGGWLNEVKVVMGILMLAFSFKFLVNIDQVYHLNMLSREVVIAIWFVLAMVLGFYLLGKIRTTHDSDVAKVGTLRLILAIALFTLATFLFTGFLGNNMKLFESFFPPKTENISSVQKTIPGNTLCETPKYADLFHLPYGLQGYFELEQAKACAKKLNKPILIDFKGHACSNCKKMDAEVWSVPEVQQYIADNFVIAALYTDDRTELTKEDQVTSKIDGKVKLTIGQKNANIQAEMFNSNALPLYVIISPEGQPLVSPVGSIFDAKKYLEFLKNGVSMYNK